MPSLLPIFSLRIPEELLEQIKKIANENCRSTNKEIEYALTQYVKEYNKQNTEKQKWTTYDRIKSIYGSSFYF